MAGRLDEGFKTVINLGSVNFTTNVFEKTVTPLPLSARGPVETTTMRNSRFVTRKPKKLLDTGNVTLTVAYDVAAYGTIIGLLNLNISIVITFPDNSTLTFYGWLDEFKPHEIKEGEQPTAEITIISSNHDGGGDEVSPILLP